MEHSPAGNVHATKAYSQRQSMREPTHASQNHRDQSRQGLQDFESGKSGTEDRRIDRPFLLRRHWFLFVARTVLLILALIIAWNLQFVMSRATFMWREYNLQQVCALESPTQKMTGFPGEGTEHEPELAYTLVVLLCVHMSFQILTIPVACNASHGATENDTALCCLQKNTAVSILHNAYAERATRGVFIAGFLILVVATGFAVVLSCLVGVIEEWKIPQCASIIRTTSLREARAVFVVVPISLCAAVCMDVYIVWTLRSMLHYTLPRSYMDMEGGMNADSHRQRTAAVR